VRVGSGSVVRDGSNGLTTFLEGSLRMQLEDRGLKELLNNPQNVRAASKGPRDRITRLVNDVVECAKAHFAVDNS
jgi:hypothetical protein